MSNENTELTIVLDTRLEAITKETKLEVSKAKEHAIQFAPYMNEIDNLSKPLAGLNKENPTAIDMKIASDCRKAMVKNRTAAEATKKERKELLIIEGRLIDGLYNVIENTSKLTEAEYTKIEKHAEILEKERKDKLIAERLELLAPYTDQGNLFPLGEMDEDNFNAFYESQKAVFEAKKAAELKAEQDRIEAERKATILTERLIALAPYTQFVTTQIVLDNISDEEYETLKTTLIKAKSDFDAEQAKIKAENERLQKEKEEADAKAAKIKAEADAILAEERRKAIEEANKMAALQKELEAKEQAEKDKLAKEKADLEAKAEEMRLALKAPIKDQLNAWIESLIITAPDNLKDNNTVIDITNKFNSFKNWAKSEINKI